MDLDDHIERITDKSIAQIFESEGEATFRKIEHYAFRQMLDVENAIIATGGGTPCFFDNMELMNQTGITIYLEAPVSILAERLKKEKDKRPLMKLASEFEIENLLEKRRGVYEQADLIYHQREVVQGVDDLVNYLSRFIKFS